MKIFLLYRHKTFKILPPVSNKKGVYSFIQLSVISSVIICSLKYMLCQILHRKTFYYTRLAS